MSPDHVTFIHSQQWYPYWNCMVRTSVVPLILSSGTIKLWNPVLTIYHVYWYCIAIEKLRPPHWVVKAYQLLSIQCWFIAICIYIKSSHTYGPDRKRGPLRYRTVGFWWCMTMKQHCTGRSWYSYWPSEVALSVWLHSDSELDKMTHPKAVSETWHLLWKWMEMF